MGQMKHLYNFIAFLMLILPMLWIENYNFTICNEEYQEINVYNPSISKETPTIKVKGNITIKFKYKIQIRIQYVFFGESHVLLLRRHC